MRLALPVALASVRQGAPAQTVQEGTALEVLAWLGGLILAVLVAAVVLAYTKRRLRRSAPADGPAFDLDQIREMREHGELTDAEYEALRERVIQDIAPRS